MPAGSLAALNPEQASAAATLDGPLLVLAGAGTGKTRVVTARAARLLARGTAPEQLLVVTFTNKAAGELRERLAELAGPKQAARVCAGTFHSFCARALREFAAAAGLARGFSICDESDRLAAVKNALRETAGGEQRLHPSTVLARISLLKNRMITADAFLAGAEDQHQARIAAVYRKYETALRRARLLDFEDLLTFTRRMIAEDAGVLEKLRDRHRYILVDEYQDTNRPQYEIVKLLAAEHRNLCVVGDDDQSIYAWRGAEVERILRFTDDFPESVVVRLETNYRSSTEILEAANRLIQGNPRRHAKTLRAARGAAAPVQYFSARDEEDEADFLVREIQYEARNGGAQYGEFAILVRAAVQMRAFEARLRAAGVPYEVSGGMSFFDRKEVRDVLAYLRLCVNPADEAAWLRAVHCPPRGIGDATLDKALELAELHALPVMEILARPEFHAQFPARAVAAAAKLRETLDEFGRGERRGRADLAGRIRGLLEKVDYAAEVARCYPEPLVRETRWAAVEEVLNFAANHQQRSGRANLAGFVAELSLVDGEFFREGVEGDPSAVQLMTLHAAKGLEFPRVYVAGVEEGLLPHRRAAAEGGLEEERRLLYVGVTRAQRLLTVSCAATRAQHGRAARSFPSRFWYELRGETPPPDWRGVEERTAPVVPPLNQKPAQKKRGAAGRAAHRQCRGPQPEGERRR